MQKSQRLNEFLIRVHHVQEKHVIFRKTGDEEKNRRGERNDKKIVNNYMMIIRMYDSSAKRNVTRAIDK